MRLTVEIPVLSKDASIKASTKSEHCLATEQDVCRATDQRVPPIPNRTWVMAAGIGSRVEIEGEMLTARGQDVWGTLVHHIRPPG